MRRLLIFSILTSASFAVESRISLVAPSNRNLATQLFAVDLDGDGDRDIASLADSDDERGRIWFENLGSGRLAQPTLFGISQGLVISEQFVEIGDDERAEILSVSGSDRYEVTLIDQKSLTQIDEGQVVYRNSEKVPLLVHLDSEFSPEILTQSTNSTGGIDIHFLSVDADRVVTPWSSQVLVRSSSADSEIESAFTADLDGDGDLDLVIIDQSSTSLYERTAAREFSTTAISFSGEFDRIIDLDLDGVPELRGENSEAYLRLSGPPFEIEKAFLWTNRNIRFASSSSATVVNIPLTIEEDDNNRLKIQEYQLTSEDSLGPVFEENLNLSALDEWVCFDGSSLSEVQSELLATIDFDGDGTLEIIHLESVLCNGPRFDPPSFVDRVSIPGVTERDSLSSLRLSIYQRASTGYELNAQSPNVPKSLLSEVVSGDFDSDGDLDLIVGPDPTSRFQLILNDGKGNFSQGNMIDFFPVDLDRNQFTARNLTVVDFNEDGHLDLALSFAKITFDTATEEVACTIVLGNGDGTFPRAELPQGSLQLVQRGFCGISELIDWDRDGDLDAIVEGGWIENIDGVLSENLRPLIGNAVVADPLGRPIRLLGHMVGDIDGDGHPDYLTTAVNAEFTGFPFFGGLIQSPYRSELAIAYNDGNGGIDEVVTYQANLLASDALGNPFSGIPVLRDLDLDQRGDLILPIYTLDQLGNSIVSHWDRLVLPKDDPRDLSRAFKQPVPFSDSTTISELVDFDGDGKLEFATDLRYIRPTMNGPEVSPLFRFEDTLNDFSPQVVALGDFDGDGDLDSIKRSKSSLRGLFLVRSLIIDERSEIRQELLGLGVVRDLASPTADADGDGVSNEIEFIVGTDPLVAGNGDHVDLTPRWTEDDQALTFPSRSNRSELSLFYDLESSSNLTDWSRVSQANATSTSTDSDWDMVTIPIQRSESQRYFRVSASHAPGR